ncbi:hypothetical protein AVEN_31340-1 [Araneus ventricosus]|uniref:Uncharacterized protein n=1 Tax=Araneus ventricosus TaxID=182803 RepID=A0A4Y2KFZ6_ARAVE|nr:hypothetical protein AVEN_31340-1 [Araneus ventricosus]
MTSINVRKKRFSNDLGDDDGDFTDAQGRLTHQSKKSHPCSSDLNLADTTAGFSKRYEEDHTDLICFDDYDIPIPSQS